MLSVSAVTASTVITCVAGVRKGRGRELGRETTRERGGRREEGGGRKEEGGGRKEEGGRERLQGSHCFRHTVY